VTAGTPLYEIDDREYRADLQDAQGELTGAPRATGEGREPICSARSFLRKRKISACEEYERNLTGKKQADARVESAEAKRDRAQLNVEFSHIAAPIFGKISRTEITRRKPHPGRQHAADDHRSPRTRSMCISIWMSGRCSPSGG